MTPKGLFLTHSVTPVKSNRSIILKSPETHTHDREQQTIDQDPTNFVYLPPGPTLSSLLLYHLLFPRPNQTKRKLSQQMMKILNRLGPSSSGRSQSVRGLQFRSRKSFIFCGVNYVIISFNTGTYSSSPQPRYPCGSFSSRSTLPMSFILSNFPPFVVSFGPLTPWGFQFAYQRVSVATLWHGLRWVSSSFVVPPVTTVNVLIKVTSKP